MLYFKAQRGLLSEGNFWGLPASDIWRGEDYINPWRGLIEGRLEVVEIGCDHFGLLREPALQEVKNGLEPLLQEKGQRRHREMETVLAVNKGKRGRRRENKKINLREKR